MDLTEEHTECIGLIYLVDQTEIEFEDDKTVIEWGLMSWDKDGNIPRGHLSMACQNLWIYH